MDLTWKDKLSFYTTEFRRRLPFSAEPRKQRYFLGGLLGGCICVLILGIVFLVKTPALISSLSSKSSSLSPTGHTNSSISSSQGSSNISSSGSTGSQTGNGQGNGENNGANTANGQPQTVIQNNISTGTPGAPATSQTAQNGTNYPPGTVVGQSQVVLQSGPTPTSSPQGAVIGTTNLPTIAPYQQSDTGTPQPNVTQGIQPSGMTWQTYFNNRDLYSIDYPVGWQAIKTIYNNHEGITLYPPGADTSLTVQDGLEEIGFGISEYTYQVPYLNSTNTSSGTTIMVDGYPGTLYTQESLGSNTVAAVFKYGNFYFGLGGTATSDEMIYVFNYMLSTLTFYGGSY